MAAAMPIVQAPESSTLMDIMSSGTFPVELPTPSPDKLNPAFLNQSAQGWTLKLMQKCLIIILSNLSRW